MRRRSFTTGLVALAAVGSANALKGAGSGDTPGTRDHLAWVERVLVRMKKIKPGMTRGELLTVFTTEGGLSTALQRTYVSRDCPYFKVDVEFAAVGRPSRDSDGRVTRVESDKDRIVKLSRPYLDFSILD